LESIERKNQFEKSYTHSAKSTINFVVPSIIFLIRLVFEIIILPFSLMSSCDHDLSHNNVYHAFTSPKISKKHSTFNFKSSLFRSLYLCSHFFSHNWNSCCVYINGNIPVLNFKTNFKTQPCGLKDSLNKIFSYVLQEISL
jgi:hypothetical protein